MAWRFTPRSPSFGEPLSTLASVTASAAHQLRDVVSLPPRERPGPLQRLQELEREGSRLRGRLMALADATFVTPIDRRDLVAIVTALDRCLDQMELAGDLATRLRLSVDSQALQGHADVLVLLADLVAQDAGMLLRPGEAGPLTAEIHRLEDVADRHYRDAVVELLQHHPEPPEALRATIVLDRLEASVNAFEELALAIEAAARSGF